MCVCEKERVCVLGLGFDTHFRIQFDAHSQACDSIQSN